MTAVAVTTNGYTSATPQYYQCDTGALFKNVVYNAVTGKFEGEPLGATVGGLKFSIIPKLRQPEVDGVLTNVKGNDIIESVEVIMEGTFKEWKYEKIAAALFADAVTGDGTSAPVDYKVITGHNTILSTDYVTNICYVGKLSGQSDPIIILLKNGLNTAGLSGETKDKGEAGIPFKFEARADSDKPEDVNKTWAIYYPNAA